MKDLGFGLVEQRTVIVVLMTATLGSLFGLNFPLNTDNILRAFIDLVYLTGYLYLARSIIRFPIAFGIGIRNAIRRQRQVLSRYENIDTDVKIRGKWVSLERPLIFLVSLTDQNIWKGWLGFVDRLALIGITVIVTLPTIGQLLMATGGTIGIALMLLIYLIVGSFSFVVEDALKRSADQHAEEQKDFVRAASTKPDFPRSIETYTVDHRYDNIGG